jgi:hypothetical protein
MGRWHVADKQLVFEHVSYPAVRADAAAKEPSLINRPQNYSVAIEDMGTRHVKIAGESVLGDVAARTSLPGQRHFLHEQSVYFSHKPSNQDLYAHHRDARRLVTNGRV